MWGLQRWSGVRVPQQWFHLQTFWSLKIFKPHFPKKQTKKKNGPAPLLFKILQFSPVFTRMKNKWHIKHLEIKNKPHQNIIYLHLTHPFHLATSIHKWQTHLPYTLTILANGRKGAIRMVLEMPPTNTHGDFHLLRKATWWLSIFTFSSSPASTFWSLRKCKKRNEIEI